MLADTRSSDSGIYPDAIATGLRSDIAFQVIVDGIINTAQHYPEYKNTIVAEAIASADRRLTDPLVGGPDIATECFGYNRNAELTNRRIYI